MGGRGFAQRAACVFGDFNVPVSCTLAVTCGIGLLVWNFIFLKSRRPVIEKAGRGREVRDLLCRCIAEPVKAAFSEGYGIWTMVGSSKSGAEAVNPGGQCRETG